MIPLWNPERLISLCSHEDGDVRRWAADRLAFLFPERAAATMLRLLADPDELVVVEAIRYFSHHPEKKFADELLAALNKSSGRIAGRLANAVALLEDARLLDVVREKYAQEKGGDMVGLALVLVGVALLGTAPSQEYVEGSLSRLLSSPLKESFAGSFFAANLIAGTDMERLLGFCGKAEAKELLPSLLFEALSRCGSWVSKDDLTEKPAKGSKVVPFVIQDSLECLGEHGYPDAVESLERLFGKRRYDDIVRTSREICAAMLDAKREASGEVSMRHWEKRRDMPFPYVSLLSTLDATLDEMPKGLKGTIARAAVAALAGVAELQSLIAIDPENLTKETALLLFLEDRPTVPQDRRIMEILAADGRPDTIIESCKNHLKEYAYSDAAPRIVDFLSRFMDEALAGCFLDLDFAGESLDDAILRAIGQLGAAAIPLLRLIFEQNDHDRIPLALQVLEDLPYQESVDLLLSHWSALWEEHGEWLLETVEFLGDRRFIPLLRKELKEGEPEEDRIFRLLCLINGVADPELKRIDREAEESRQKEERVMEAIEAGDFETLLSEPLDVSLTCRACNSVFHYRVRSVQVGIDSMDVIIMDPIVCKKCGALDHYETGDDLITAVTARLAMLDALPDDALPDPDSMTVIPVETISALGKGMSGEELITKYERKLAKEPENAELLLGYANVLRQMKRAEDAVPFYERVLERDPLAVEALGCLGDHAFFRGDFEGAFARYGKAVEIMEKGHYYRVQADVDRFKEAVLDRLVETAERLGRTAPVVDARMGEAEGRKKVGRNDPCPCGSGKKYKKCCLLRESGQGPVPEPQEPRRPVADPVYQGLQKELDDYSRQIASRKDFLRGAALYWNTKPKDPLVLPDAAAKDQGEFNEWFIHDFRLDSGKTVVESFLETKGSSLTEKERALVEALSKSYRSIYEVQEVREGSGLTIKDLFTGVEMDVEEISGSYSMVQWDVIHIRVYTSEGAHKFGGNGRILPRKHLRDLLAYLNDAYRDTRGGKPWSTFLKENSFLVGRFFDNLVENPPLFLTEEKHRVISSRAHFVVSNYDRARNILVGQYDFGDPEEVRPQGIRLSWLKRGASKVWETGSEKIENAIVTTSNMVHPSGRLGWTVLGTVNLHPDKLTLECMSRERLDRGKTRLEQLIGGFIRHRADEFEDIYVGMERVAQRNGGKEKPVPDEKARAMAASIMKRQLSTWPDQRLPILDGKTPREAVATNEGRQKVLDLIKDFENMEARKTKEGELSMDLGFLRKELGV